MRLRLYASAVSLLVVGCGGGTDAPPRAAEPARAEEASAARVRVETARIELGTARLELSLPGEVEGGRDALLAAALGGYVERVLVEEGASVKRGQSLARIDTSVHLARRDQAAAEYAQAKAEHERAQALGEAISETQRERAATRLKVAEAALAAAEAQVARSLIIAPFDGIVAALDIEVGEVAPPGAPVARLVQLDPIEVSVAVSDRDVVAIEKGMAVTVTADATGEVMRGVVSFVGPAADLKTRAFTVKVTVPNPKRALLPGMIANVRLAEDVETNVAVIPQYVLVTRLDGVGVFVDDNGVARWRPLALGRVVGDEVVVEKGLAAGERIVVTGHRELIEGDRLLATREGVCCKRGRIAFEGAAL